MNIPKTALIALLLALATATSCIPIAVSQECKERINACLRNCQSTAPPPSDNFAGNPSEDFQSPCERDCNNICD